MPTGPLPRRSPAAAPSGSTWADPDDAADAALWTRAEDYIDTVDEHWRGLLLVAAALEALMGLANLLRLTPPANVVMAAVQGMAVVVMLLAWRLLHRRRLPHRTAQPLIALALVLFGAMLPLEMALTGNALLTANLGLVIVGGGAFVVQTRWYVTATAVLVVAWAVVLATRGPWDLPVDRLIVLMAVALLLATLVHLLRVRGRNQLVEALAEARHNALRDDLTGLWNRRGARVAARPLFGQARRSGEPVWAVIIDIAGLKRVNDRCGHPAGDRLLLAVGRALAAREDVGDVAVRWGGDEFVLVGDGPVPDVDLLVGALQETATVNGGTVDQPWHLDPGIAMTVRLDGGDALDRLVAAADEDLYARRGTSDGRVERT